MIRIPLHIQRSRHGIYFFRIVVPKVLRGAFDGQAEIKRSLHTRELRAAMLAARPLAFAAYELFAKLGSSMSGQEPTPESILGNLGNIRELKTTITSPLGVSVVIEEDSADPAKIAAFHTETARARAEATADALRYREKPIDVPPAMADFQEQSRREVQAFVAELEVNRPAAPNAVLPVVPDAEDSEDVQPFKPDPKNVLSKRWAEYVAQKGPGWAATRTQKSNPQKFNAFMDWWGKDVDIRFVTRKVINGFIDYLVRERVLESGPRKGQPGLNTTSVDNYTTVLNGFLTWAQEKHYFPESRRLPTEKQSLTTKSQRQRRRVKSNPAYSKAQLTRFFNPNTYHFNHAHHFWPPLIALFTGARRREVAQLLLTDIKTVMGIPAISINIEEDENKSVKTRAAIRTIPVHPELLAIGFLEYVEDTLALGLGPELFPGIGVNANGEKGNAVGNAWGRYKKAVGEPGAKNPTFHSFRSSALKVLKENGVPFEMRCQLAGHEMDHVSQSYDDSPFSVKDLMEQGIPKWIYEGLDLSKICYKPKQFDRANTMGEKQVVVRESRIAVKLAAQAKEAKK